MSELRREDLRPLLPRITMLTLVLGAWSAYEPMGAALQGTQGLIAGQYAGLKGARASMSQRGRHFLMWDDADRLAGKVKGFLAAGK